VGLRLEFRAFIPRLTGMATLGRRSMTSKPSALVVGAGIVGLATARALAQQGYHVKVSAPVANRLGTGDSVRVMMKGSSAHARRYEPVLLRGSRVSLTFVGSTHQVVERELRPIGASIRNFGMLWPIGQPSGALYRRARRTVEIWTEASCLV
jgi:threonine dehydrogenase-like Zn-dependent dehydrogenase